jgi:endoglucanase
MNGCKVKATMFTILLLFCSALVAEELTDKIRLNQIGFYPNAPKLAVVVDAPTKEFYLLTADLSDTVYSGTLSDAQTWSLSEENVSKADFTDVKASGLYVLLVPGLGYSYPFEIHPFIHQGVGTAALKGYYYQRASLQLEEQYAGIWARPLGHPDNNVYIHASAATALRPENTIISSPKGWYDAGDYNKYIVNGGISTYTLLALYEHFPQFCDSLKTNIPESRNALPDVLDEALWELRWMLTMQDPNDGGVYHKLTCANFQGFVMPHAATARRYVVQKSTTAMLNFAAVMAQAARIFENFQMELPGLADSCLAAALYAWDWARLNPDSLYRQSAMNQIFSPAINTGEYSDSNTSDEFKWAAMELYATTKADSFITLISPFSNPNTPVPNWGRVETLGFYTLAHLRGQLTPVVDTNALEQRLIDWADDLISQWKSSPYEVVMGRYSSDFVWGSNSVAANQALGLIQVFNLTADSTYLWAALSNLDYLLGRNAVGYCFVTGFGDKSPMKIHHRQSASDRIVDPVPGLIFGGPNPGKQDGCAGYISDQPAQSFVDSQCSYASNEIAINWNAPFAYVAIAIEAIMSPDGLPGFPTKVAERLTAPSYLGLETNYPNPFNATTIIQFSLARQERVSLRIFDILGRQIATLVENELKQSGTYSVRFDASDLASGVYVYQLRAGDLAVSKKMLVMK